MRSREFTLVVERYPSSRYAGLALYWQGRSAYQLGRDEEAAAALDRYLRLSSDVPYAEHATLLLANSLYNQTRYEAALQAALEMRSASGALLDDYLALFRDLLNRLPRAEIEAAASRTPTRNFLAPFYLQAARWAHAAGDATRASDFASRVTEFPELPPAILAEARVLIGPGGQAAATAPSLGLIAPTEGRFAEVAEQIRRGVELALEDVNRTGQTPVALVTRSAENDPDSTAAVIRTLARNEHVAAILGPLTSEYALPAARLAVEEGVPLVSPTATDARLLEIDPRVYTVNALDGGIGHTIGTYAATNLERQALRDPGGRRRLRQDPGGRVRRRGPVLRRARGLPLPVRARLHAVHRSAGGDRPLRRRRPLHRHQEPERGAAGSSTRWRSTSWAASCR